MSDWEDHCEHVPADAINEHGFATCAKCGWRYQPEHRPQPTAQGPEDKCGKCRDGWALEPGGEPGTVRCSCTPSAKAGAVSEEQYLGEMIDWVQAMGEYGSEDGDERMAARVIQRLRSTPAPDVQENKS